MARRATVKKHTLRITRVSKPDGGSKIEVEDLRTIEEAPPTAPQESLAFPRNPPCPRCKGMRSLCTRTAGRVQYRECLGAVCRYKFKSIAR